MNKLIKSLLILLSLFFISVEAKNIDYDYSSTYSIPIKLVVLKDFSTKNPCYEGEKIKFKIIEDVYDKNNKIIPKDTIVEATIETIISSGMNGFPYEVIFNHFEILTIKQSMLMEEFILTGQNRCIWVYPLKWVLTPIPFVGSLTNLIKGGHAKINTNDIITIYYYPKWI